MTTGAKHIKPPPAWVLPFEAQCGSAELPCGCIVAPWAPHTIQQPCEALRAGALSGLDTTRAFENPAVIATAEAGIKAHVAEGVRLRKRKVRTPSAKAKQASF